MANHTTSLPATADCCGRELPHLLQTTLGSMREWYDVHHVIPTSNVGDAALVRAWLAYHRGMASGALSAVAPSRGHSMKFNAIGLWERVRIIDPMDHRQGVALIQPKGSLL